MSPPPPSLRMVSSWYVVNLSVAGSYTGCVWPTGILQCLRTRSMLPQVLKSPSARSLRSAVSECDVRVFARKLLMQMLPANAVRSMPPSKKLSAGKKPEVPDFGVYGQYEPVCTLLVVAQATSSCEPMSEQTVEPLAEPNASSCNGPKLPPGEPLPS